MHVVGTVSGRARVYTLGEGKTYASLQDFLLKLFHQEVREPTRRGKALPPPVTEDDRSRVVMMRRGRYTRPTVRCHPGCRCNQRHTLPGMGR